MTKLQNRRKKFTKNLFKKMRLLVINEDTLEEKFSLRLTLMNVFVVLTLGAIIIISVTTYIIAFTPLREYIPGYSSSILKKSATELAIKSDSLETIVRQNNIYIESIKKVLNGDLQYAQLNKDSIMAAEQLDPSKYNLEPTPEELKLREQIEQEDKYNLFEKNRVKGKELSLKHYKQSLHTNLLLIPSVVPLYQTRNRCCKPMH